MSREPLLDHELVLFDLDDTLCDSHLAHTRRLRVAFALGAKHVGRDEGLDFDEMVSYAISLTDHGSDHFPDVFARFGIAGDEPVAVAREWILGNRLHGLEYFHDAIETLQAVRAARSDRRVGIITNGPDWIQRPKVELLGLADHVDFIVISGEFGVHKPDPTIFQEALRLGDAEAANTVFIGDSIENDVGGAHGVGMTTIWMDRFGHPWPAAVPEPHYIAPDLSEVRRLLGV
jgi:putative hydrolase of the HAD superfamily